MMLFRAASGTGDSPAAFKLTGALKFIAPDSLVSCFLTFASWSIIFGLTVSITVLAAFLPAPE